MAHGDLTLISANEHLIEPEDVYKGRMPAKWADRAPRYPSDTPTAVNSGSSKTGWCRCGGTALSRE